MTVPAHTAADGLPAKVAIVITGLEVGGAETFLAELLTHAPDGVEFRVFSLIDGGPIAERIEAMGITVTGLHMLAGRPSLTALLRLTSELRAYRPDIVHTWLYHADLMGGLAARFAGVRRVIWHLHNSDLSPDRVRLQTRTVVRACALLSHVVPDVIVSCSEAGARNHVARGYVARKVRVIPNGVDTDRFTPDDDAGRAIRDELGVPHDRFLLGLVARVDSQKNHPGFFDAVRVFFERGGDAQFVLAGRDVTDANWLLPKLREATPHPERVVLIGPRSDVPRVMAALDVATSSSLGEAFPLVLIEAMACGTPCAATDVGDSALIVGDTGIIVPPNDASALADAWLHLAALSAEERASMGRRARERVLANYSIDRVADQVWDLYREVGRSRRAAAPSPTSASKLSAADFEPGARIAYLSLQAVSEGQDSWAAVREIIGGWERSGWAVDTWFPRYPSTGAPGPFGRAREMWRVQRALKDAIGTYDALYVRGHTMAYPASRWARRAGIPVFQECNGTYEDLFIAWPAARLGRPVFEQMQRAQYRDATLVFCGTEPQRIWLEHETHHERICISPNGANVSLFRPDATPRPGLPDRFVLFFGQFAPWQGLEFLAEAKRHPAWPAGVDLVFVGDGERRPVVEQAVTDATDGSVHYLGRLPYEELPGVISQCLASTSVQYTPDRGETGFSALKLYESMSCGVPVIGTDYPGVGNVIRRYGAGIVVPPGDAGAIARAVAQLAADTEAVRAFGAAGRTAIENEGSWGARAEQRRLAMAERMPARCVSGQGSAQ
ncbi:MAG: glycosyltransferase [Coriobacteriia bacterium]|nr:glycosyltransferase [Coriobacteriia bacterium]